MSKPSRITLRPPSKYSSSPTSTSSPLSPPPKWLHRTWSVTHSTLSMWRSARNVRITYTPISPSPSPSSPLRIDDLVEYESLDGSGKVKSVAGVDTASNPNDTGAWDWRGKGWLFFVSSHWEILGWGERPVAGGKDGEVERWVVTWFAPTLFTKEGVDVYSDRREGVGEGLLGEIMDALKGVEAEGVRKMCERDMRAVRIELPWKER
ncbi:hypothetical protein GE09DRAFT_266949 [Coniochaeta sp. 2T2.1]|nr:hypothetical protein GE09DRAFT_266949 [Coniochaeta sp. 2T2.1]